MKQLLNTLYLMTPNMYAHLDHETLKVEMDRVLKLQVPLHHLGGIVCFGNVMISPGLIQKCAEDGRTLVFLDRNGRFKARIEGPTCGNVLLRMAQYEAHTRAKKRMAIARNIAAGKLQNSRSVLMRGAREAKNPSDEASLRDASHHLAKIIKRLPDCSDLEALRGHEGEAGRSYFYAFDAMIVADKSIFAFNGRSRRPPRDPVNATLSFLYALLLSDCISAAEGVGLDPQLGFLHAVRPGRPSLALDLMEELRSVLCDRVALTLINRKQITEKHFEERPGGAVLLTEKGRKKAIVAYQKRKQDEVTHEVVDRKMPFGLVPHVQARLLARMLRGDITEYLAFRC
ncbi:MAG: type I-C CRISPR-associated endonuclease Cas1 [Gaiellales bacterium]|nr:MAG: type I-C CRISPR-associated endonuclease Cas1 [Gaiellales bacterium]